jgi:hypothetical protein
LHAEEGWNHPSSVGGADIAIKEDKTKLGFTYRERPVTNLHEIYNIFAFNCTEYFKWLGTGTMVEINGADN